MKRSFTFTVVLTLLLAIVVGCRRNKLPQGLPPLHPCSVTIMMDGAPLAEANVTFFLTDVDSGKWSSAGVTDENGKTDLWVRGKYPGTPAGHYKVTVSKSEEELDEHLFAQLERMNIATDDANENAKMSAANKIKATVQMEQVAEEFTDVETTPLETDVKKWKNALTLDVPSAE